MGYSAARMGSGGISLGVEFEMREGIARLRQDLAKAEKELKARPKVEYDFQEAATNRGMKAALNRLERLKATVNVVTRFDERGMLRDMAKAGALSAREFQTAFDRGMLAIRKVVRTTDEQNSRDERAAGLRFGRNLVRAQKEDALSPEEFRAMSTRMAVASRPRRTDTEQDVRDIIGTRMRRMRTAARQARAEELADERMFGKRPEEEGDFETGMIHGPAVRPRFSQRETAIRQQIAQRIARMRASAQDAEVERRLFGEEEPASVLEQLAGARGGRRAPSRAANFGLMDLAGGYFAARGLAQTMQAGVGIGVGAMQAGSSNAVGAMTGQGNVMGAINSIPLLGSITKLFDEATGFTRSLRVKIEATQGLRTEGVEATRLQFNRVNAIAAEGKEKLAALRDTYAQQGVTIQDNLTPDQLESMASGTSMPEAARAAGLHYAAMKRNVEAANARALQESTADNAIRGASIKAEGMRAGRRPFEASLTEFDAQAKAEADLADPAKRGQIADLNAARRARMLADRGRELGFAQSASETKTATSEMRVRNRGLFLKDEEGLALRRGIQQDIDMAPEEGGYKARAMQEGLASARAFKASLLVRGGGMGRVANAGTDLIGDPYNLDPELRARGRAAKDIEKFIGGLGKAGAYQFPGFMSNPVVDDVNRRLRNAAADSSGDLSAGSGSSATSSSALLQRVVSILEVIADQGFRSDRLP